MGIGRREISVLTVYGADKRLSTTAEAMCQCESRHGAAAARVIFASWRVLWDRLSAARYVALAARVLAIMCCQRSLCCGPFSHASVAK